MSSHKEAIIAMLKDGHSYREIEQQLGCSRSVISFHARRIGHTHARLEAARKRYDWQEVQRYHDEGHSFTECKEHFGMSNSTWAEAKMAGKIQTRDHRIPLDEILTEKSPHPRPHIRARLLRGNVLKNECAICGISAWLGKPLSLDLDHINGISDDHRLENLRMLCPNCHSQTETYRGRNKKIRKAKGMA